MIIVAEAATRKKCPHCGATESYQQGPLTICESCGEVLAESWALQDAVTDIADAAWLGDLRSPTPTVSDAFEAKTQLQSFELMTFGTVPKVETSSSEFDAVLGRALNNVPSFQAVPLEDDTHDTGSLSAYSHSTLLRALPAPPEPKPEPPPPPALDPSSPLSALGIELKPPEPVVITGTLVMPPPAPPALEVDGFVTSLHIEEPKPPPGPQVRPEPRVPSNIARRKPLPLFAIVLAAAVAVMLLLGFILGR
jgi:hypothetical protein